MIWFQGRAIFISSQETHYHSDALVFDTINEAEIHQAFLSSDCFRNGFYMSCYEHFCYLESEEDHFPVLVLDREMYQKALINWLTNTIAIYRDTHVDLGKVEYISHWYRYDTLDFSIDQLQLIPHDSQHYVIHSRNSLYEPVLVARFNVNESCANRLLRLINL
ncbi:hypothetical protein [Vibrio sp. B1Z05]|uniref:hypothetical protein n=1 Tax=Vibrio sp. B1Z05 TaxID=2654980 RepID=UPI00128DFFCD|nr:hypothetical protein [Vibrio sp. B1Z05]MPW37318.1 hypothetical protein [Vibrio sp. B1Z05]